MADAELAAEVYGSLVQCLLAHGTTTAVYPRRQGARVMSHRCDTNVAGSVLAHSCSEFEHECASTVTDCLDMGNVCESFTVKFINTFRKSFYPEVFCTLLELWISRL